MGPEHERFFTGFLIGAIIGSLIGDWPIILLFGLTTGLIGAGTVKFITLPWPF